MSFHLGIPVFIEHASRRLFALQFNAAPDVAFRGIVLHLPAFAEEMNKSRAMVASQARSMANQGYTVLVPDYFGTGDSSGEFSEANWTVWLEDMRYCLRWLQAQVAGAVTLWGIRLGALMALELAGEVKLNVSRLVLWNPVLQGEQFMLQFLRLRLVKSMMYGAAKEKVADLKQQLEENGMLEVAGYELSASMFREVAALKAMTMAQPAANNIYWADVSSTLKSLPVPTQTLLDQWQDRGLEVEVDQLKAPQFWATQEISRADELIEKTTQWLAAEPPTNVLRESG